MRTSNIDLVGGLMKLTTGGAVCHSTLHVVQGPVMAAVIIFMIPNIDRSLVTTLHSVVWINNNLFTKSPRLERLARS